MTTTLSWSIRPGSPADADGVRGVFLADRETQLTGAGVDPATARQLAGVQLLGWQAMLAEHERAESVVVVAAETVTGVAVVAPVEGETRLLWIGVAPPHRRRGLARGLLLEVLRTSDAAGRRTTLQVDPANAPARALYSSLGFTPNHTDIDLHMVRNPRRSQA